MGRGSERLLTVWIPFMRVPVELGGLTVLQGSRYSAKLLPLAGRGCILLPSDLMRRCRWQLAPGLCAHARNIRNCSRSLCVFF